MELKTTFCVKLVLRHVEVLASVRVTACVVTYNGGQSMWKATRAWTSNVALVHAIIVAVANGYALPLMRRAHKPARIHQMIWYVYQCQVCDLRMIQFVA